MHLGRQADNPDLHAKLRLISVRALTCTGGSGAAIALAHGDSMICRASVGTMAPPLGCRLDITSGFSGECVSTGKALRCDDSENDCRVDLASCRQLGVRSLLAVPIFFGRDIVGLLEVFSSQPFAFNDSHVAVVKRLAQTAIPTTTVETIPPPKLLVEQEQAYQVFWRNLIDVLRSPGTEPSKLASASAPFWSDVFVPSPLPWARFLQSMLLHVILLATLGSVLDLSLFQTHSVQLVPFNKTEVIYYSPSDYRQALAAGAATSLLSKRQQPWSAEQAVIKAPREKDNRARMITPPNLKLKDELLHLVAWSAVIPAMPLRAITRTQMDTPFALSAVVAPPPTIEKAFDHRISAGFGATGVIGPPPDVSGISKPHPLTSPVAAIGPPPSMRSLAGQPGEINLGRIEAVGPAPQMSPRTQGKLSGLVQATLGGVEISIVPPPPSLDGTGSPGRHRMESLSATQVERPAAAIQRASEVARMMSPAPPNTIPSSARVSEEKTGGSHAALADAKELSVSFIGLALTLPSSSYFASHEVFIAENRLSRYQSRLIKLVYEFLPYQNRLSDYGPNYPAVDKLRVTRDPSCDETLTQVMSSVNWPQPNRMQEALKNSNKQPGILECYRTTADDYRKVRTHHR